MISMKISPKNLDFHLCTYVEFTSGNEYVYKYESQVLTGIPSLSKQYSGIKIVSKVKIAFVSSSDATLQVSCSNYDVALYYITFDRKQSCHFQEHHSNLERSIIVTEPRDWLEVVCMQSGFLHNKAEDQPQNIRRDFSCPHLVLGCLYVPILS